METIRVSVRSKRFINRGFASGPYCPIYGFGMCIVILLLNDFKDNIPMLFILGMTLCTLLEYFTSYVLELIFKAKWWDYSYRKYNLHGRICLDISIAWGMLSVTMMKFVVPVLDKFLLLIPFGAIVAFEVAFVLLMLADVVSTVYSIVSFQSVLTKLSVVRNDIKVEIENFTDKFAENVKEYIDKDELNRKLASVNAKPKQLKQKMGENYKFLKELGLDDFKSRFKDKDYSVEKLEKINKIRNLYTKYELMKKIHISNAHKRIIGAFPNLKLHKKDLQEILNNIKSRRKNFNNR
jgi:uncharacterized membrane protein